MQKQISPVVIILVVVVLIAAGWLYWGHLNKADTPQDSKSNPSGTVLPAQPGSLDRTPSVPTPPDWSKNQGTPSQTMVTPTKKPTGQ